MEAKRRIHRDVEEIPEDHTEKLWAFWEKWGLTLLTAVAVLLAVVAVYRWVQASQAAAHERSWGDLAGATSPETLRQVAAENASDPAVYALAQLRAGDLLLGRVINPVTEDLGKSTTKPAVLSAPAKSASEVQAAAIKGADEAYSAVLAAKDVPTVMQLNAKLGLATVAEARSQWDKARELYQAIAKQAGDEYPTIKAQAVAREGLLDRLPGSLAFAPEKPATQPADLFPMPHLGIGATTQPSN